MPSYCSSVTFRKPVENEDGSFTIKIAGDSKLHEYNGLPLKELSTEEYMSRAAPPVMLGHGWRYELPIGMTKEICYNEDKDEWMATFMFAKDDEMADKTKNLFQQGLLYASITWYIDELSRSWREADRKLREWSLTATPRDVTVLESFQQMGNSRMCDTKDKHYSQEQLDAAVAKAVEAATDKVTAKLTEKFGAKTDELSNSYQAKLDEVNGKFTALEDGKRVEELSEAYSDLLPETFEADTPREVLVRACGNMLEESKSYSMKELTKIADNLMADRASANANKPTPDGNSKSFSSAPDLTRTGDVFLDILTQ